MVMMNKSLNSNENHVLSLKTGEVRDRLAGQVVAHLPRWNRRERLLSTELYLASGDTRDGLKLSQLVVLWPEWLENANDLQHVRRRLDSPIALMNQAFKSYGWKIIRIGVMRWALLPNPKRASECVAISEAMAVESLIKGARNAEEHTYDLALRHVVKSLQGCYESQRARLLIGTCCFTHNKRESEDSTRDAAGYLLDYERNLRRARDVLSVLWSKESKRKPERWGFIPQDIREIETALHDNHALFEGARAYLYGSDHETSN